MQFERVVGTIFLVLVGHAASAQEPAPVDFARDVQPILQQHCVSCHGPELEGGTAGPPSASNSSWTSAWAVAKAAPSLAR